MTQTLYALRDAFRYYVNRYALILRLFVVML